MENDNSVISAIEQGEDLRKELLKLLSNKEQKEAKKLHKDIKKGKKIKEFNLRLRKEREDSICLVIPKKITDENMIAYRWDNAGDDFSEYEYFKIYDNKFKSISANRDINQGVWSKKYNKHINYTKEEFLAELRIMYCILIELNLKRFETPDESRMKVNLFFRKVVINIQKNSKYVFSRRYVFAQLNKWRFNYLKNPNQTLLELESILGDRGKIVKERDFMLRDNVVIKQIEGEYNSFLSRLFEDRKRHSIKNLFSSGLMSDLRGGYLRPIMTDDLNLCKKSHREIKKVVNKYNEELTGGTYNSHLDNYVEVAEYVAECFDIYIRCEKMCKFGDTLYNTTNIECPHIYTKFTESKYFPKVSDVERELNVGNRRSITKSLQSLKRPIEKAAENAESILMLIHPESYNIENVKANGKNRLAIVPKEDIDSDELVKIMKAKEASREWGKYIRGFEQSNLKSLFEDYKVNYTASLEYYRDNDFDVERWSGSESMPKLIKKDLETMDDADNELLRLIKQIELM